MRRRPKRSLSRPAIMLPMMPNAPPMKYRLETLPGDHPCASCKYLEKKKPCGLPPMLPRNAHAISMMRRPGYALNSAFTGARMLRRPRPSSCSRSKRALSGSAWRSGMIRISGISASAYRPRHPYGITRMPANASAAIPKPHEASAESNPIAHPRTPASTSSDRMTSAIVPSAPANTRASISHATKKCAVGEISREPGENRVRDHGVEQQAATSEDIGQRRYEKRADVAEADQRQQVAQRRLGNLKTFLDLLQREGQQRAIVLIEKSRGGRDEKDAPLTLGEWRRASEEAEWNAPALLFGRGLDGVRARPDRHSVMVRSQNLHAN